MTAAVATPPVRVCPGCEERPKDWEGSDPKCGFPGDAFNPENWKCATLDLLREEIKAHAKPVYCGDQSCVTIPISDCGEFLVVTWYKNRGCTEGLHVIDGAKVRAATLVDVGEALDSLTHNWGAE